jgi:hypothetical protein
MVRSIEHRAGLKAIDRIAKAFGIGNGDTSASSFQPGQAK